MKRLAIAFVFSISFYLFLSHLACDKHPVTIASPPNTPTATSTPIQVQISVLAGAFSPDPVTIQAGQVVIWTNLDTAAHAIQTDDGTGLCQGVYNLNSTGQALTITFSTPATINYHDWNNCINGGGTCNYGPFPGNYGCDGSCAAPGNMTGIIFVQ